MIRFVSYFERLSRTTLIAVVCLIVVAVAVLDYSTGFDISFSFFYLGAIALATWCIGSRFALFISIVSVTLQCGGDLMAGARGHSFFVSGWNAILALAFYTVTVRMLAALRSFQVQLETRVEERTQELTMEMQKRQKLENEILAVSDREQQRIGHDIHDSLCQHLTAVAIAGEVLREKLETKRIEERADAEKITRLVEEGITLARSFARGLSPVALEAEGLMAAFQDLAAFTSERFHITCRFYCPDPVLVNDPNAAAHLFRIAQEAITNAIKHGFAKEIVIELTSRPGEVRLAVKDGGIGLPSIPVQGRGMGMHIMRHRAQLIGAEFKVERRALETVVECLLRSEEETLP